MHSPLRQNAQKPKCPKTKTPINQNVPEPKCPKNKMSEKQNVFKAPQNFAIDIKHDIDF
jgi:hypothetical protein